MAFTVKGEYERLLKFKNDSSGHLAFECGCVTGYVTDIEYIQNVYGHKELILIYGIAGTEKDIQVLLAISEEDVKKRYQDRRYRCYRSKYGNILERYDK